MSSIKVLAGDLEKGTWSGSFGVFTKYTVSHPVKGETFALRDFQQAEMLTEENKKKVAGTLGWAAVGAIALGPIGALGGALLGGRSKEVCFAASLKNGRKFMATTDMKTWQKIQASIFEKA
ncbi:hypothetical protein [Telmatospirillum sp. J64-1]|uniref:hypothetical protein n=1 Tax=Telmatospirillum sp. J64-1 TaxID=2502183 RepID=UPI00115EDD19|nr:hypothetical protein [Telmatospirillum sp. J64-1]